MPDDIRSLSAALASDPSSLRYVDLAELLRRRGQPTDAMRVVMHGLSRHPGHADGYDTLARIHTDRNELSEARAAWDRALAIDPEHTGALKGIGFLYFRQGDTFRAQDALERAMAADPADDMTRRALAMVRGETPIPEAAGMAGTEGMAGTPASMLSTEQVPQLRATGANLRSPEPRPTRQVEPPPLTPEEAARAAAKGAIPDPRNQEEPEEPELPAIFEGMEGATADILLLDARGLVLAGGLKASDGSDASELAAAALAGVSGEASRTAGYLSLGIWSVIVAEAETANVVLSPVGDGALLMARRERSTPVGLAIRMAERARNAAARWLAGQTA